MASTTPQPLSTVPPSARVVATNEKVTGPAGAEMLRRSGVLDSSSSAPLTILDNACGGGVVTSLLLEKHAMKSGRIIAADNNDFMLDYTRQRSRDNDWTNVNVEKFDQTSIALPDGSCDFVFSNFGIFFHPNDAATLSETYRVLKESGTAGFTSWSNTAWWTSVAVPALKAYLLDAPALPENVNITPAKGWTDPGLIPEKLEVAGFKEVQVTEYAFTPNVDADEFAEAMAVLVKVMMRKLWSEEDYAKWESQIEPVLLRYLKEHYSGGKWDGKMVAIITTGRK